jgi:hypothetical protein
MVGILLATAVSTIRRNAYDLATSRSELIANLRLARSLSMGVGVQHRIRVTAINQYTLERMRWQYSNKTWTVDTAFVRSFTLPDPILFTVPANTIIQFDARGAMILPTAVTIFGLRDGPSGPSRLLSVYPSGQVVGS